MLSKGATTLSIMTFSITTFSITTLSIKYYHYDTQHNGLLYDTQHKTLSIMTHIIMGFLTTLNITTFRITVSSTVMMRFIMLGVTFLLLCRVSLCWMSLCWVLWRRKTTFISKTTHPTDDLYFILLKWAILQRAGINYQMLWLDTNCWWQQLYH